MKIKYDKEVDILVIELSEAKISESDEPRKGIILDYDEAGNVVRIEILDASKKKTVPMKLEYEVV
jgi:YD repeat-containing protein